MAMLRAMDSAVAGLRAHQSKLDVIGHNIANVNTFGYKSQNYSFQEAMYQTSTSSTSGSATAGGTNAAQYGYGSLTGSISMDMTASTPTYVGGFNATISGEGFFVTYASPKVDGLDMQNIKGTNFDYTRVGQFLIDSNGYMVDSSGNFVYGYAVDTQGTDTAPPTYKNDTLAAIQVPEGVVLTDIKINKMGEVTGTIKSTTVAGYEEGQNIAIGQVAIITFQNPEGLTKAGGYYYNASSSDNTGEAVVTYPGDTATATLMTGYLEASNVDLAKEFSEMITAQRGFQANTKMITVSDEVLNELVNMKR